MASNWLHSVCIWPRFRYFTIRVYTQVIWNVCPYKYLQLDKAEQIHCHLFLVFLIPRQIIPFRSRVQSETRLVIASCIGLKSRASPRGCLL